MDLFELAQLGSVYSATVLSNIRIRQVDGGKGSGKPDNGFPSDRLDNILGIHMLKKIPRISVGLQLP